MKAIILAAGEGSRLGNISAGIPKCLIKIEDNTLLEIQINLLHSCGIEDISIVRGYAGDKINIPGIKYYENPHYAKTNILHSLFCACNELDSNLLILYSDIIFEEQALTRILDASEDLAVGVMINWKEAVRQRNKIALEELEMVHFDSENRIEKIGKNLDKEYDTQGQFIGIVKCSSHGAEILKRNYDRVKKLYAGKQFGKANVFEKAWLTDLFQDMTDLGVPLNCVMIERGWMEIDTPEDYERALTDTKFVRRLVKVKTNWDTRAQVYNSLDWVNRDELLANMVRMAAVEAGMKVLDLGTGTGKVLAAFKKYYPDAEYFGVDINQSMLDKIDKTFGFTLSIREIEDLHGFKDNEFDLVSARMVFHHANNLEKAMQEVHRILKPGGRFIICEGNPPDQYSAKFYKEMFRFKEDRITFMLDDLVNLLVGQNFNDIHAKIIIMRSISIDNWLDNSGLPYRNIDIIKKMHYECDALVQKAYNMKFVNDDIFMDWKFSIVSGKK